MKCPACQCRDERRQADIAFIAGIAFVLQHNNEAISKKLCDEHKAALLSGAKAAQSSVRPEDRR